MQLLWKNPLISKTVLTSRKLQINALLTPQQETNNKENKDKVFLCLNSRALLKPKSTNVRNVLLRQISDVHSSHKPNNKIQWTFNAYKS